MDFSGEEFEQLVKALTDAYPRTNDLRRMVQYKLDQNLEAIAGDGNLEDIAFELVLWAKSHGKIDRLVGAAHAANPDNEVLLAVYVRLFGAVPTGTANQQLARNALDGANIRAMKPATGTVRDPIDWLATIVDFDMHDQECVFKQQLAKSKHGALAIALLYGDCTDEVLNGYVFPRVQRLIEDDQRRFKRRDIWLRAAGTTQPINASFIETEVLRRFECSRWAGIFEGPGVNALVVVWNQGLPPARLRRLAEAFRDKVQGQVHAATENRRQRLIVVWVDLGDAEVPPGFAALPALRGFDVDLVIGHLRDRLEAAGLSNEEACRHAETLRLDGGGLPATYVLMRRLIDDLAKVERSIA